MTPPEFFHAHPVIAAVCFLSFGISCLQFLYCFGRAMNAADRIDLLEKRVAELEKKNKL